jgi:hypothetical protein
MADDITPEAPQGFDPTALDDAALAAEFARVAERGRELAAKAEFADGELAEFSELGERLPLLQAETAARVERAQAQQAQREAFASVEVPVIPAVTPIAPVAAVEAPVSASEADPVSQPVAVPSVSQMAAQAPVTVPAVKTPGKGIITAHVGPNAGGFVGRAVGEEFAGTEEISRALISNAQSFGRQGGAGRQAIAQFRRNRGAEFTIDSDNGPEAMNILRHARDEKRLHGGSLAKAWQHSIDTGASSLTAAAGWCAPSQNDYDLCRNWSAGVGILDVPTVTVTRGGINYTDEPTFPEIYANAIAAGGGSNFLTEAQVIADTAKTCSEIPCPTFENRRLDVMALCIRVSFLQAAGYPEVVNAWQDGLLAAHEQEMNRLILADIIARAGAATVLAPVDADATDSFTAALLAGVDQAAEDIRYRFMMAWDATVEVVLPHWVLPQMRADLSRRSGDTGGLLCVSDSYIASLFSCRNVRVQYVRGWQDGLITGGALNAAFPGGDAATPFNTSLPSTVSFLAFPAGSVAVARQDVVTLTNVYDAASLAVNEFTALFAEEGFAPVYPCPGQRLYTVTGCVGGTTGAHVIDCTDAP